MQSHFETLGVGTSTYGSEGDAADFMQPWLLPLQPFWIQDVESEWDVMATLSCGVPKEMLSLGRGGHTDTG